MGYHTKQAHKQSSFTHDARPRELVGLDLAVELPPVKSAKHILIMVDYATNFVMAEPIVSRSEDILQAFMRWTRIFGIPHAIRHDQELGLSGGEFADFCENHKITQMLTLPYKSNKNGKFEVQVRNLKHALQKQCLDSATKNSWPDQIWKVQLALNTSVSLATKQMPERLMFNETLLNKSVDIASILTPPVPRSQVLVDAARHQKHVQSLQIKKKNEQRR
jgi:hypothetical protein